MPPGALAALVLAMALLYSLNEVMRVGWREPCIVCGHRRHRPDCPNKGDLV